MFDIGKVYDYEHMIDKAITTNSDLLYFDRQWAIFNNWQQQEHYTFAMHNFEFHCLDYRQERYTGGQ